MSNTICSTANCGADLGNLCDQVVVLFNMKADILSPEESGGIARAFSLDIEEINDKLEKELGLQNHQTHFEHFFERKHRGLLENKKNVNQTKTFIVKCFRGHENQYILNCP